MEKLLLETCVDSVSSALAADRAGADRLELCANLIIGGTTPDPNLFDVIRAHSKIKVNVLIRPRFGDFCYDEYECEIIKKDIELFRKAGADGVVIGILNPDGSIDLEHMKEFMKAAGDMNVTFHRAFDVCRDAKEALEQLVELGVTTILTSGQQKDARTGSRLIKELVHQADGRIDILVGGGIGAEAIYDLYLETGARSYHMSGKETVESPMTFRRAEVSMGVASISEYIKWETRESNVRRAKWMEYFLEHLDRSDLLGASRETWMDYIDHGSFLWDRGAAANMPEELFLQYVLFPRVNNEEVRPCRSFFYEKICEYLTMRAKEDKAAQPDSEQPDSIPSDNPPVTEQMILRVNDWCNREASYRTTDGRTSSALTVYEIGYGRCGEESVLGVNAMRSLGIPARQVYTPFWAHCDDNHAWVEVWMNGTWYFLGACEPASVLNKGWFNYASSRAMMVHSRTFGLLNPENERITGHRGSQAICNQLERYAPARDFTITVREKDGSPAVGADLTFGVLNYGHFSPIANAKTDEKGRASLHTGKGSLWVYGVKNAWYQELILEKDQAEAVMILDRQISDGKSENAGWEEFYFTAPRDTVMYPNAADEKKEAETLELIAKNQKIREEKVEKFRNIALDAFLKEGTDLGRRLAEILCEKDKKDITRDVLEDTVAGAARYQGSVPKNIFEEGILQPRVLRENLRAYRAFFAEEFSDEAEALRAHPERILERITARCHRILPVAPINPTACWKSRENDPVSTKVLFVAIARSLGIPSRCNPEDMEMEYWNGKAWMKVLDESNAEDKEGVILNSAADGTSLVLTAEGSAHPVYGQDYFLQRMKEDGFADYELWEFPWEQEETNGGWMQTVPVLPGQYRITTAVRIPSGDVLGSRRTLQVPAGSRITEALHFQTPTTGDMLRDLRLEELHPCMESGEETRLSTLTDGGKHVIVWAGVSQEPTEHILNELADSKARLLQAGIHPVIFLNDWKEKENTTLKRVLDAYGTEVICCKISFRDYLEMAARRVYTDPEKLPLIILTDARLHAVYATSGYNVGTVDLMIRIADLSGGERFSEKEE